MSSSNNILAQSHVCPWWLIHTFDNPLRRLIHNPDRILRDFVRSGDHCLDLGCGYGYFSLPMARLVGPSGMVTAVDLQPEMLAGLSRRAEKLNLRSRIQLHQADASGLHRDTTYDFALAFWMVHEVPDQDSMFQQLRLAVKPGGKLMLVEPKGHVRQSAFILTVNTAEHAGFATVSDLHVSLSRAVLMINRGGSAA